MELMGLFEEANNISVKDCCNPRTLREYSDEVLGIKLTQFEAALPNLVDKIGRDLATKSYVEAKNKTGDLSTMLTAIILLKVRVG